MKLINLTPHTINIKLGEKDEFLSLQPSGEIARVKVLPPKAEEVQPDGWVLIADGGLGAVEGLPDPCEGVLLVVSAMVRTALPERSDLASPGLLVRDAEGKPLGCAGLVRNP